MKLLKPLTLSLLAFAVCTLFPAESQAQKDWSMATYLNNLPPRYKSFSSNGLPFTRESTIIDEENGYAAYFEPLPPGVNFNGTQVPILEMALFRSEKRPPLVVVSNRIVDSNCERWETFFLRHIGKGWSEVDGLVLPPLDLRQFWPTKPESATRTVAIVQRSGISYRFQLPRRGTQMRVNLAICDYLEDDVSEGTAKELQKLIGSVGTIRFDWNAKTGKFFVVRHKVPSL